MLSHMVLLQISDLRVGLAAEVAFAGLEPVVASEVVFEVAAFVKPLVAVVDFAHEGENVFLLLHIINF